MAKVIKAGAGPKAPLPAGGARMAMPVGRKVLEREVYQAQAEAKQILDDAAAQREKLLQEAKKHAAQAREEAMAKGAAEAFAQAASEALLAFRRRADRYGEAADDIRTLAMEVVKKVLGADPALPSARAEEILKKGMAQLRARRRLRLQVPASRLAALADERPKLMRAVAGEPDLLIEAADDVNPGFARVVTEIGGALCAEQTALDSMAEAVGVVDDAPKPRPRARFEEKVERARERRPAPPPSDVDDEPSFEETDRRVQHSASDESTQMFVEQQRARPVARNEPARRPPALADRSAMAPSARPGTRALQIDADPEGTQALDVGDFRKRGLKDDDKSEVDDSMELYTDDAVAPRRRR